MSSTMSITALFVIASAYFISGIFHKEGTLSGFISYSVGCIVPDNSFRVNYSVLDMAPATSSAP